ncbi:MAG: four helix bundle protein, partial [Gemmatimonadaceae bacterium]
GVYRAVSAFPSSERFELSAQLRRAAVSVEANIAEGCGHSSDRQVARFFQIAMASASEAHCELLLARDLEMIADTEARRLVGLLNEVQRMLAALMAGLRGASTGTDSRHKR